MGKTIGKTSLALNGRALNGAGPRDEYVCSGSDSGHIFLWERSSGRIARVPRGGGACRVDGVHAVNLRLHARVKGREKPRRARHLLA